MRRIARPRMIGAKWYVIIGGPRISAVTYLLVANETHAKPKASCINESIHLHLLAYPLKKKGASGKRRKE